jgi:hypothetical protein
MVAHHQSRGHQRRIAVFIREAIHPTKTNPGIAAPGFCTSKDDFRGRPTSRLQLSVFMEDCAAIAADAPAMGGERCATTHQASPRHATGTIAHSSGGRLARREFGEIDRVGGRSSEANQKACGYHRLHAGVHPSCLLDAACLPAALQKIQHYCATHNIR